MGIPEPMPSASILPRFLDMLHKIHGPIHDQALVVTASKRYEEVLLINNYQAPSKRDWMGRPAAENITKGGLSVVFWTAQSSSQAFVLREPFNGVR